MVTKINKSLILSRLFAIGAVFFSIGIASGLLLPGVIHGLDRYFPPLGIFLFGAVILLILAFLLTFGPNPKNCNSKSLRVTKIILWFSTALAGIFLIVPLIFVAIAFSL